MGLSDFLLPLLVSFFIRHHYHFPYGAPAGSLEFPMHLSIHATTLKLRCLFTVLPIRLIHIDFDRVTNLVRQNGTFGAISALQGHGSLTAYIVRCVRFT